VVYQGQLLATTPAPLDAPTLRARGLPRAPLIEQPDIDQGTLAPPPPPLVPVPAPVSSPIPGATHPWRTLSLRNNHARRYG